MCGGCGMPYIRYGCKGSCSSGLPCCPPPRPLLPTVTVRCRDAFFPPQPGCPYICRPSGYCLPRCPPVESPACCPPQCCSPCCPPPCLSPVCPPPICYLRPNQSSKPSCCGSNGSGPIC